MIRKARMEDMDAIAAIYDHILTQEEAGATQVGWLRGIYPTRDTALAALNAGDLFVLEEDSRVAAAGRINRQQVDVYAQCPWKYPAPPEQVMVLHTLVVEPALSGRGLATQFVRFYEDYAREKGCPFLRMDTNARNTAARRLYRGLGYWEAAILPTTFNGIPGVELVCLEKYLDKKTDG